MRFKRRYRSRNVRDQRFATPARPGISGLPIGAAGGGIGGILVLLLILFLNGTLGGGGAEAPEAPPRGQDPEAELVSLVSFVFDDAQSTWTDIFEESGRNYRPAEMVLFRDATDTACGFASSDVGPFYCPADERVYLDLGFFEELRDRFGAEGDFAQAYVIAHEVAHHVQHLLGINERVQRLSQQNPSQRNELSIQQELQADCFAGVWGKSTRERGLLQPGDVQEGLGAAAAVGDDRIQREAGGRVNPETWTHGSAEQRQTWFQRGFRAGDAEACDTFAGA
ncbi:MAG TPA: neutral zinc metallopeptidase [Actinomycetota bacterium]